MSGYRGRISYPLVAKQLANYPGEWTQIVQPKSLATAKQHIIRAHRAGLWAELRPDGHIWIQYPTTKDEQ